jgi:antitoxin VapB
MPTARVFKSGNSQAVRLPKEFRFKGKEVEISRRGDEVILREKKKQRGATAIYDAIMALPLDAVKDIKDTRPPQERKGL